ncbi:MAG: ABC transporter ATP-binding protein [Planctomycetota bacterium]
MTNLSAQSISFGYGRETSVLERLTLQLQPGELLVLLGGNGSGKTTLMRLLAGHLRAQNGQVTLDEQAIQTWSRTEIAKRLTLMPQFERCDLDFSVREMVQLGRTAHRGWCMPFGSDDERAVNQALTLTGLRDLETRPIKTLSGGQWRRAVLARSLAQESSILLLDEPTSGLDLRHQFECLERLQTLVAENGWIAVVTLHDLNHAAMFADRVAIVADRSLLAIGEPERVLTEQLIEEAFGIRVIVARHPVHGTPLIVPTKQAVS